MTTEYDEIVTKLRNADFRESVTHLKSYLELKLDHETRGQVLDKIGNLYEREMNRLLESNDSAEVQRLKIEMIEFLPDSVGKAELYAEVGMYNKATDTMINLINKSLDDLLNQLNGYTKR